MAKLEAAKGQKLLLCLLGVFIITASVVTRATIGGVIEQYDIPLSDWTASMYTIQSAMICVYSMVFTILLAIPLGIYFLGGGEQHQAFKMLDDITIRRFIVWLIVFFVVQFN